MLEELWNSTTDERHLHLRRPRSDVEDTKRQVMWMLKDDFDMCRRCYGSTTRTHCPRLVSVDMHIGRIRAQFASPSPHRVDGGQKWSF